MRDVGQVANNTVVTTTQVLTGLAPWFWSAAATSGVRPIANPDGIDDRTARRPEVEALVGHAVFLELLGATGQHLCRLVPLRDGSTPAGEFDPGDGFLVGRSSAGEGDVAGGGGVVGERANPQSSQLPSRSGGRCRAAASAWPRSPSPSPSTSA